jgi:hypothetical protein
MRSKQQRLSVFQRKKLLSKKETDKTMSILQTFHPQKFEEFIETEHTCVT